MYACTGCRTKSRGGEGARERSANLAENSRGSAMAFHENAGPRQVDFDLPFLKSSLSFMAEVFRAARSSQGRVLCGVSEPLTARTALSPFRQEGKGAVASGFLVLLAFFLRAQANPVATLPSALSMSDFWFRSVQVGCSRFSRCCHLFVDLSSISR